MTFLKPSIVGVALKRILPARYTILGNDNRACWVYDRDKRDKILIILGYNTSKTIDPKTYVKALIDTVPEVFDKAHQNATFRCLQVLDDTL